MAFVDFPSVCGFPAREGNRVRALVDGAETYAAIHAAIRAARRRVWVVVSFAQPASFRIAAAEPPLFEYLAGVCARGVDVRLLVWDPLGTRNTFFRSVLRAGDAETLRTLDASGAGAAGVKVRWDRSPHESHCHHEKTWLVDDAAFTGGVIPSAAWVTEPGHADWRKRHDIFCHVEGPAAGDVFHSFAMRWNNALGHACYPSWEVADDIAEESLPAASRVGDAIVQVLRDIHPGHYTQHSMAPPAGQTVGRSLDEGEASILAWYRLAISAAQHHIYIENQHIAHPGLLEMLKDACARGVKVVFLVPSEVLPSRIGRMAGNLAQWALGHAALGSVAEWTDWIFRKATFNAKSGSKYADVFLRVLPSLKSPNFLLAGLAGFDATLRVPQGIYVHSKLLIADDHVFTIGSANLVDLSLEADHTELNVAVFDAAEAESLRRRLFSEHMGAEHFSRCEHLTAEEQYEALWTLAHTNAALVASGQPPEGQSHVYAIDPRAYGAELYLYALYIEHVCHC